MRPVLPHLHGSVSELCKPSLPPVPTPWHCCRGTHSSALSHSFLPLCHRQSIRKWTGTTQVPSTPMRWEMPWERQVSVLLGDAIRSPNTGGTAEIFNGFSSLLSPRSQHCQRYSPFLTVTHCNPFAISYIKLHPLFCTMNQWYFCPCCDHCLPIWLLLALFLASLFPNLIVVFQSYAQTLFFLHFLPPPFSPLEKVQALSRHAPMMSSLMRSLLEQRLPAKGHLEEHWFFDLSCAQWILCEWSRDRNSMNMGLNRAQCVMWAIGSAAIAAIHLQCQVSLIRGLSGEHRTGYAVKQCEICSLTKCCGRTLCLSSPSTMGFGKDSQRWVWESSRPSGRNSPALQPAAAAAHSHIPDSKLPCCVSEFCALLAPRFQAERGGAAQHRHPLRLQHPAEHRLRRLRGLHDPPGDPVQWVPRGSSSKLWGCLRCSVPFSCECSKLHRKVRESSRETAKAFLSEWPWGAGDRFPEQTRGSRGHVSITHQSLVLHSHLMASALVPTLSQLWQMGPFITCSPYSDLIYRFVPRSCQMPPHQIL